MTRRRRSAPFNPEPEELAWLTGEPWPEGANPFVTWLLEFPKPEHNGKLWVHYGENPERLLDRLRRLYGLAPDHIRARVPPERRELLEGTG